MKSVEYVCVSTRFRFEQDARTRRPGWRYLDGDQVDLLQARHPGAKVERLYQPLRSMTSLPLPRTSVERVTMGPSATACFAVTLDGKRYVRHGDLYMRWYEARNPLTGSTVERKRIVQSSNVQCLVDLAIESFVTERERAPRSKG